MTVRILCGILLGALACTGASAADLCADGASPTRAPTQSVEGRTLDNRGAHFEASESWQRRSTTPGFYGVDYAFRPTAAVSDPARWELSIPVAGLYGVQARWTAGENRSSSAKYIVHHSDGETTLTVDQRQAGGEWFELGRFWFRAGATAYVELSCWSPPGAVVIADAIRIQPRELCGAPRAAAPATPRGLGKTTVLFEGKKPVVIGVVQAAELSPAVKAFLDTIAAAEGTGDTSSTCGRADDGYGALFGCFEKTSRTFSDYSRHPERRYRSSTGYPSAAAGRYQFIPKTWEWVAPKVGATDISPANQDRAATWLLGHKGALVHVEAIGADNYEAFNQALYASRDVWASLPAAPYGQPTHTAKDLWVVYQAAYARY